MRKDRNHPRAFTLVELMVGMVVTLLVLSAMSVFLFGVGDVWQQTDPGQSIDMTANRATDRIDHLVRSAMYLDPNFTPGTSDNIGNPAACMVWTESNGDGQIQFAEQSLLQYDPSTQTLYEYTVQFPSTWTPAQQTAANITLSQLMTPTAFAASANVVAVPVAHDVTSCTFNVVTPAASTGIRPTLEVVLTLSDGRSGTTIYHTSAVRSPEVPS
jgi:hypothetical protein